MAKDPSSGAVMLWVRFALTFNLLYQEIKKVLGEIDLTIPQTDILVCLNRTHGLPLGEIAERLLVTGGNITGLIDRLERDGYVYRERDFDDRRVVRAKLTDKGFELCRKVLPFYNQCIQEITGNLNQEEQRQMQHLLKKLGQGITRSRREGK